MKVQDESTGGAALVSFVTSQFDNHSLQVARRSQIDVCFNLENSGSLQPAAHVWCREVVRFCIAIAIAIHGRVLGGAGVGRWERVHRT